ncbi:MAG: hypothetical protein MUF13_17205, partial [Akkermansiaceae bacterium]|nr:hypothetical protein [Akkermansiaceae bacterium]
MKASHIIPPAAALLVVVTWNLSRWQAVASEEKETTILREKVQSARIVAEPSSTGGKAGKST